MQNNRDKTNGSITVFLTFIFVIFMSLITAFIENVRVISSEGYVRMAADSAIEMTFGKYNKELYEEYNLFGYGGYNGIDIEDLEERFSKIVEKNLQTRPDISLSKYSDLYRLQDIECKVDDYHTLYEDEVFLEQISDFLLTSVIDDIENLLSNNKTQKGILDKSELAEVKKYENGEYDEIEEEDENGNKVKKKVDKEEIEKNLEEDEAGGNPLDAIKDLVNTGILSLVCDESKVSDEVIKTDRQSLVLSEIKEDSSSAASFFESILDGVENEVPDTESLLQKCKTSKGMAKVKYMCYADKVFSSYLDKKYKTVHYGLEYLIAGKESDKANLASIVKRLLVIRTAINFIYVSTDPGFQSKSELTADIVAGLIRPLAKGLKYTILMIIAFEEACIDVTALLEGRSVPLIKDKTNFKMRYSDICRCSHSFFKKKAAMYQKGGTGIISGGISYKQYLMIFLFMTSTKKMKMRIADIIQYDLRERYNQTFDFGSCICYAKCSVDYVVPYTYSYTNKNIFGKLKYSKSNRQIGVSYGYVSEVT